MLKIVEWYYYPAISTMVYTMQGSNNIDFLIALFCVYTVYTYILDIVVIVLEISVLSGFGVF